MTKTLKNLIQSYKSYKKGEFKTFHLQVIDKIFLGETIKFPGEAMVDLTFSFSTFKNSSLINMEFINCVFKNCRFINCNLSDVNGTETIFNKCTFLTSDFGNAFFESSHFLKPIFKGVRASLISTASPKRFKIF